MSFPKYEEYKDSGVEWLGEIPKHWKTKHAKYLFLLQRGHDLSSDQMEKGEYPVFGSNGIIGFHNVSTTSAPNVTVGRSGSVGSINYVKKKFWAHNTTLFVKDFWGYHPRFIFYLLIALNPARLAAGSAVGTLDRNKVHSQIVVSPSYTEAVTISYFLDHETSRIDALIAEQERLIALLKEKRQAVISHAVTKGLDSTVPMKDSGVEWLGEVPEHWDVQQLKHVVHPNTSITYGIVQAGPNVDDGIPYIKTSDMSGDKLPLAGYSKTSPEIDHSYKRSKVLAGDIVVAIRATVGKCLPVPLALEGANLTQGTARISPGESVFGHYLLLAMIAISTQAYFTCMSKGATFKEITLDALRRTPIVLPPYQEQIKIVENLQSNLSLLKTLTVEARATQKLLQERRSALISAAVTGKIDVRNWQPPADTPSNTATTLQNSTPSLK